jgi:hypothetical protein
MVVLLFLAAVRSLIFPASRSLAIIASNLDLLFSNSKLPITSPCVCDLRNRLWRNKAAKVNGTKTYLQ